MSNEEANITDQIKRIRAKVVENATKKGIPLGQPIKGVVDADGRIDDVVPFHKKNEDELTTLMQQVAEQTNFAQRDLGAWSLLAKKYGKETPAELELYIDALKQDLKILQATNVPIEAPQPSGLGAVGPTTLQEGTPGGETQDTSLGLKPLEIGNRVLICQPSSGFTRFADMFGTIDVAAQDDAGHYYQVKLDGTVISCATQFRPECLVRVYRSEYDGKRARVLTTGRVGEIVCYKSDAQSDIVYGVRFDAGLTSRITWQVRGNLEILVEAPEKKNYSSLLGYAGAGGGSVDVHRYPEAPLPSVPAHVELDMELSSLGRDQLIKRVKDEISLRREAQEMEQRTTVRVKKLETRLHNVRDAANGAYMRTRDVP